MTESFWSGNSLVPSWSSMISHAWSGHPPKLLETIQAPKSQRLPAGCVLKKLDSSHVGALVEFWGRYFSISSSCRCIVPATHVNRMLSEKRWEGFIIIHTSGELLGSIVRRFLKGLHVREASWASAGAIDYFCVHPAWRKRGIGRCLLNHLHNAQSFPIPPHLIYWDTPQIRIPPMVQGVFLYRKTEATGSMAAVAEQIKDAGEMREAWKDCVKGVDIWTEEPGQEISGWVSNERSSANKPVVIWNTFHRALPDGGLVGIVLSHSHQATEALAKMKSPWGVLLVPVRDPFTHSYGSDWKFNSAFQWIAYNLSVGFVSGSFPIVGF